MLTICTSHPGFFIGYGGKLIEKYRELIKEKLHGKVVDIQFVETARYTI